MASDELKAKFPNTDPFLLYKWERAYNKFFDTNESGEMDWGDSYLITRKVREIYGADSTQMSLAKKQLKLLWEELLKIADKNADRKISLNEWVNMFAGHDPKHQEAWYLDYATFMFKLFDVSEDNYVDLAEYADGMLAYGHHEHEAHTAFHAFARDSKGNPLTQIDFATFRLLWNDYFYSNDKTKPGNHLFGEILDQ